MCIKGDVVSATGLKTAHVYPLTGDKKKLYYNLYRTVPKWVI